MDDILTWTGREASLIAEMKEPIVMIASSIFTSHTGASDFLKYSVHGLLKLHRFIAKRKLLLYLDIFLTVIPLYQ
jgi:hypothetical protein